MNEIMLIGTTDASGNATIYAELTKPGRVYCVEWIDGTLDNGVDAVLSNVGPNFDTTILALTDANNDARYYPREQVCGNTGSGLTLDGTRLMVDMPLVSGRLKLAISSGGETKTGGCRVYCLD